MNKPKTLYFTSEHRTLGEIHDKSGIFQNIPDLFISSYWYGCKLPCEAELPKKISELMRYFVRTISYSLCFIATMQILI